MGMATNLDNAETTVTCLGEMAVYAPISGGYIHFIERWYNPAVGFAIGWQVCFQYCLFLPSEIIAANILVSYWDTGKSSRIESYNWPDRVITDAQNSPSPVRLHI